MEVCIFATTYFITNVLKIQNMNNILYMGIAVLFVAILVCRKKVVFKIMYIAVILSILIFNLHTKQEEEYKFVYETKEFSAVALENEQKYEEYSAIVANITIDDVSFKSKIYFENNDELIKTSDKIYGEAYIYTPSYSYGFDRENYYKSNNINVLMSADNIEIVRSDSFSILRVFSDFNLKIQENLVKTLDNSSAAFIKGLVLGDKSDFDPYFSIDISKAGISHILAVSGMHVGFLAGLCMIAFGKRNGGIYASIIITAFLFIVGPSPSILRAVIMQYMINIAWILNRENSSKVSVWLALVLILAFEPYIIYDVGFILSFSSSISIIYLYPLVFNAIKCKNHVINKFIFSSIAVSLSVTVGTTFALFYYFGYISTAVLLSNLLIIPIVMVLFPFSIIFILLSFVNLKIVTTFAFIIEYLVALLQKIITFIASFDYILAPVNILQIVVLFLIIIICGVSFYFNKFKKITVFLSIIAFTVSGFYASYIDFCSLQVNIFSVGDGQCILVRNKDEITVIDCGSSEYYTAAELVNEYMYKYACEDIDNLIITSIDNTHLQDVIYLDYEVKNIIYPEKSVRSDANEILIQYIEENSIKSDGNLPEYIQVFDDVDKKLAVLVEDTLILHGFTNLMLEQFIESNDVTAKTVVLADKTIGEYKRLQVVLDELSVENVILSNDYDMLSRVSGYASKTTAEYGDIVINYGGYDE